MLSGDLPRFPESVNERKRSLFEVLAVSGSVHSRLKLASSSGCAQLCGRRRGRSGRLLCARANHLQLPATFHFQIPLLIPSLTQINRSCGLKEASAWKLWGRGGKHQLTRTAVRCPEVGGRPAATFGRANIFLNTRLPSPPI